METLDCLFRDVDGSCRPAQVLRQGDVIRDRHGFPLTPAGETLDIHGWGALDGPAVVFAAEPDAGTAYLVPAAAEDIHVREVAPEAATRPLAQALAELERIRATYAALDELADVWAAIEAVAGVEHIRVAVYAQHATRAGQRCPEHIAGDPEGANDDVVWYTGTRAGLLERADSLERHADGHGAGADLYRRRVAKTLREAAE